MSHFSHAVLLRVLACWPDFASRRCGWWSLLYYAACTDDIAGFWRAAWCQIRGKEW